MYDLVGREKVSSVEGSLSRVVTGAGVLVVMSCFREGRMVVVSVVIEGRIWRGSSEEERRSRSEK
jgi:hypothetical protein